MNQADVLGLTKFVFACLQCCTFLASAKLPRQAGVLAVKLKMKYMLFLTVLMNTFVLCAAQLLPYPGCSAERFPGYTRNGLTSRVAYNHATKDRYTRAVG
eukprot:1147398-Pelagomonas_calceolata.AAC.4